MHDPEIYDKYRQTNGPSLATYGGKFLVRGGDQELLEGEWSPRTVVIEFPSYADTLACYKSEGYQAAKALRDPVSEANVVIVEGYLG